MNSQFWLYNPSILLKKEKMFDLWPKNNVSLAEKLNARNLLGVNFEPVSFIPTSIKGVAPNPKYQNIECFGVKLIITDRKLFSPIEVGIWVLREIFIQNKNQIKINESSMNRLFGSERLVLALNNEKLIVELLNILREEEY